MLDKTYDTGEILPVWGPPGSTTEPIAFGDDVALLGRLRIPVGRTPSGEPIYDDGEP